MCSYYGLKPDIKVISPWREWDLTSRSTLIKYAESRGIEVPSSKRGEPPFSMDANLLHISYEGYNLASVMLGLTFGFDESAVDITTCHQAVPWGGLVLDTCGELQVMIEQLLGGRRIMQ